jgi:hypothetical protein
MAVMKLRRILNSEEQSYDMQMHFSSFLSHKHPSSSAAHLEQLLAYCLIRSLTMSGMDHPARKSFKSSDATARVIASIVVAQTRRVGGHQVVVVAVAIADDDVVVVGGVEHLAAVAGGGAAGLAGAPGEVADVVAADVELVVVVVAELGSMLAMPLQ